MDGGLQGAAEKRRRRFVFNGLSLSCSGFRAHLWYEYDFHSFVYFGDGGSVG